MATKALSYLRVSGKSQIGNDGFPRQRDTIQRYAKANGLEVVEEFRDEGVSGTKEMSDRAGLADLLDRLESNGVRIVLVERADRVARSLLVGEVILGQFRKLGVQVVAADSGADLTVADDDPTRTLIRQVLGAVAQFEKSVIVLKLRAARERKRRRDGRCEGRKAFGDRPNEVKALNRLRQLRRKPRGGRRLSYAEVADALNCEGLSTRSGKPWNRGTVHSICKRLGSA
ncbi:MAG: recombinase family protein [Planctomycetaceae bacterium]|nr:recombinase family protein [Planctomycetaceae bacterium]